MSFIGVQITDESLEDFHTNSSRSFTLVRYKVPKPGCFVIDR